MDNEIQETRRLLRSRSDRMIAGVCGGLGEYFDMDSNIVRIIVGISVFFGGLGAIFYIAAIFIVPENPSESGAAKTPAMNNTLFWGMLFVGAGLILLLRELDFFNLIYFPNVDWTLVWAIFFIIVGGALMYDQWRKDQEQENNLMIEEISAGEEGEEIAGSEDRRDGTIFRSLTDRKIAGICGGLAVYFNIDSTLVRLAWVLLTIASKGLGALIYIVFIFVFPEAEQSDQKGVNLADQ